MSIIYSSKQGSGIGVTCVCVSEREFESKLNHTGWRGAAGGAVKHLLPS